jgi:hypothetical protein
MRYEDRAQMKWKKIEISCVLAESSAGEGDILKREKVD